MKKLEMIAVLLLLSTFVEISTTVSLYTIISDAGHVTNNDNRLPRQLQPVELATDLTNHLGFTILDLHSNLNKNNVAFSPCGLMSVLVALYEGSNGKSAIELKDALAFPRERDIVRIGVRDIHRRLRSYFYKKENLLSGLIFNKENITIKQEYETVLRFYGYDLDGSSNMLTETRVDGSDVGMTNVTEATDLSMSTTTAAAASTTPQNETTNAVGEGEEGDDDEDDLATTPLSQEEQQQQGEDDATTTNESNGDENEDITTTTVASTRKRRGRLGRGLKSKQQRKERKQSTSVKSPPAVSRRSRSYYVLLDADYENEFHLELEPSPLTPTTVIHSTKSPPLYNHDNDDHHHHHHQPPPPPPPPLTSTENPISTRGLPPPTTTSARSNGDGKYRNNHNHKDLFQNVNSDTIEHIFYLNDYDTVRVPYKLYDTVMKYAYVNSLEASFLEIDLDSDYYNLIIIMPDRQDGLSNLARKMRMHEASTLRQIRNAMEFYWVKTIVPKFSLKGNTILTNDLQNMGINDIFEPTKADFSLLADDKTLYVKNVEQTVNINIRTQSTQQLKKISSLYKRPIEVPVNFPFIFCVVDKKLDLIIILGRILNPLNSRIQ